MTGKTTLLYTDNLPRCAFILIAALADKRLHSGLQKSCNMFQTNPHKVLALRISGLTKARGLGSGHHEVYCRGYTWQSLPQGGAGCQKIEEHLTRMAACVCAAEPGALQAALIPRQLLQEPSQHWQRTCAEEAPIKSPGPEFVGLTDCNSQTAAQIGLNDGSARHLAAQSLDCELL